ncbi:hypothetical protein SK128_025413 [Halocaridina rubra]|uniref:Uncharacterized protein n=1 Tax=Halocaridina rubra TaxID=373956 RepID=A0AAN9A9A0_HALRR
MKSIQYNKQTPNWQAGVHEYYFLFSHKISEILQTPFLKDLSHHQHSLKLHIYDLPTPHSPQVHIASTGDGIICIITNQNSNTAANLLKPYLNALQEWPPQTYLN